MTVLKIKIVRLRDLMKASGKPVAHVLWIPPEQDPAITLAAEENRVLSVHQLAGVSRKDFGVIGLLLEPGILHFIFPKPLAYAGGTKVIGIDYDLLGSGDEGWDVRKGSKTPHRKLVRMVRTEAKSKP